MDERVTLIGGDSDLEKSKRWKIAVGIAAVIAVVGISVSIALGVQLGGYKATASSNFDVRKAALPRAIFSLEGFAGFFRSRVCRWRFPPRGCIGYNGFFVALTFLWGGRTLGGRATHSPVPPRFTSSLLFFCMFLAFGFLGLPWSPGVFMMMPSSGLVRPFHLADLCNFVQG